MGHQVRWLQHIYSSPELHSLPVTMPTRRHSPPTDFISLRAWIANTPPYSTLLNLDTAVFPDVNDFTTGELEEALRYGMEEFQNRAAECARLRAERRDAANVSAGPSLTLFDVPDSISQNMPESSQALHGPGPIALVPFTQDSWIDMIMAAKFSGDIRYQNCLIGLAAGIRLIKRDIRHLEVLIRDDKMGLPGDPDDWFAVQEA